MQFLNNTVNHGAEGMASGRVGMVTGARAWLLTLPLCTILRKQKANNYLCLLSSVIKGVYYYPQLMGLILILEAKDLKCEVC